MPLAGVAGTGTPTRRRRDPAIGGIIGAKGRAEAAGVVFNHFPALGDALPGLLEDILFETVDDLDQTSEAKAPIGPTGKLRSRRHVRVYRSRSSGGVVSSTITWEANDPYEGHSKHEYPFYVEVGTVDTAAQPFVVPSIVEVRPRFRARLMSLEARAKRKLGIS